MTERRKWPSFFCLLSWPHAIGKRFVVCSGLHVLSSFALRKHEPLIIHNSLLLLLFFIISRIDTDEINCPKTRKIFKFLYKKVYWVPYITTRVLWVYWYLHATFSKLRPRTCINIFLRSYFVFLSLNFPPVRIF